MGNLSKENMVGCYFIYFFLIIFLKIHLIFLLQEKKFLMERNGPHIARISIFEVCNELNLSVQNVPFFFLFYAFSLNKMRKFLDEEV